MRDTPVVYRTTGDAGLASVDPSDGPVAVRVAIRALEGMLKEALVSCAQSQAQWRMVSDEGPYLNGTDLAPPPLSFFSAGMASSYASAILTEGRNRGLSIGDLELQQDNFYTMEGSALRGTMIGGALPVRLKVSARTDLTPEEFHGLVTASAAKSPLDALMREKLTDTFSLTHNGEAVPTSRVVASPNPTPPDPETLFAATYATPKRSEPDAVIKIEQTDSSSHETHGSGASLKESQKRQLHVRSTVTLRDDGLREIRAQLFKPFGSVFRFLSDDSEAFGGKGRAPSGLAYASAGLAFCFMTQLGRYASITKNDLRAYGVVQDILFDTVEARTSPVDTHTFLESPQGPETAQQFVDMGEQTCFLHAACRDSSPTLVESSVRA